MPSVTAVDSLLKQMAAARGSSIEGVVNAALRRYLKINYSGVGSAPNWRPRARPGAQVGAQDWAVIRLTPKGVRPSHI
jgi:hypothetical protein